MNDAVIAIKKDVINQLNGFYPWKCGADTEFAYRLEHNKFKKGSVAWIQLRLAKHFSTPRLC